jgi:hypothetical protein
MGSFILVMVGLLGLFMFGSVVNENVLKNVGDQEGNVGAQIVLGIYMVVLVCHCPYISFSHKEALLVLFDELHRRSLSNAYQRRAIENEDGALERSTLILEAFDVAALKSPSQAANQSYTGLSSSLIQDDHRGLNKQRPRFLSHESAASAVSHATSKVSIATSKSKRS